MGVFGWILMGLAELAPDNKTISPPLIETAFRLPGSGCHLLKSTSYGLQPAVKKGGVWTPDRADQGRHEHKAACGYRTALTLTSSFTSPT